MKEKKGKESYDSARSKERSKMFREQFKILWGKERNTIQQNSTRRGSRLFQRSCYGGKRENRYDNYVASVEELELTNDIDLIYKQIYSLQDWIEGKLELIGELKPLEKKIILLREEQNMIWRDIAEATSYSERQAQRIYDKYYKREYKKRSQS